jgi:twitching motility protein PilT
MYQASELELNKLLSVVLERNASDLHMVTGEPPVLRIDGVLTRLEEFEVLTAESIQSITDVLLSPQQKELFAKNEDVDLSYSYKDNIRFRINVYRQKGLLAAAFRLIPNYIKTVQELDLPASLLKFTEAREGLVLLVGPTGHGKSTTLAALVDYINATRVEKILTIEDPIEFMFNPRKSIVTQREVNVDTPSFEQALKSSLREDANVILVGEMRDYESISSVITIAETGHLVFATVHTNDAPQTIDRIIDVFPPHQQGQIRSQLASLLIAVVSIRLLPKVGGGRVPAIEILVNNHAVRNIIREGKTYQLNSAIQTSYEEGMIPMDRSLVELVRDGKVTMEDAQVYVKDLDYFQSVMSKGIGA